MSDLEKHTHGGSATDNLPERFPNPGLPPHRHRMADHDKRAERNAERQVVVMLLLSALGTIFALVAYFVWKPGDSFATLKLSTFTLGMGMAVSLFFLGIGAVHWAKTLMPDEEVIELRHSLRGSEETRQAALDIVDIGAKESGIGRRPLIRNTLIAAMALFPLPGVLLLRDLGPLPGKALFHTLWGEKIKVDGVERMRRLTKDPYGEPIKAADVTIGSVFHVIPEGMNDLEDKLEQKAKAAVLLVRINPEDIKELKAEREGWDVDGIFAYSKICTHVGCPVALYEQQTHHLLCPCHQSTFDLTQYCAVVFGPASRALPQLPITVDDEGYLIATADFPEPTGPSFWERD